MELTGVDNFSRSVGEGRYDNVECWKREGGTVFSSTVQMHIPAGDNGKLTFDKMTGLRCAMTGACML